MEEFIDLGNGVTLGLFVQKGRPAGSSGVVQSREAHVSLIEADRIARVESFLDPVEARAVAQRLAEERR